jgi:ABC-type uncharacterized transport system substrate-binding protein
VLKAIFLNLQQSPFVETADQNVPHQAWLVARALVCLFVFIGFLSSADRQSFAEVKVTGWVEENDLQTKVKAIRRLLPKEDMVKISIYHKKGQTLDKEVSITGQKKKSRLFSLLG